MTYIIYDINTKKQTIAKVIISGKAYAERSKESMKQISNQFNVRISSVQEPIHLSFLHEQESTKCDLLL
jgi:predicted HicB family RNase H-like nuclease